MKREEKDRRRKKRIFLPPLEKISLPCEELVQGSGEEILEYFGPICKKMRCCYGGKCHYVCRLFKADYEHIALVFNQQASNAINDMDDRLVIIDDKDTDGMVCIIRMQAQILEVDSQFNAHQTRINHHLKKRKAISFDHLFSNFYEHRGPWDFPRHWKVMLNETNSHLNTHYARERFQTPNPSLRQLWWTYRMGGGVEFFRKHHPDLFHCNHQ